MIFATNNTHKLREVKALLPEGFHLQSLKDIDCNDELPETGRTINANALQKAMYVSEKFGVDCFADDSGLEVDALGGEPGVYSARYAGRNSTSEENVNRLLHELKDETNRSALFRTVIALIIDGSQFFFEGIIRGTITDSPRGNGGFGYDPIFIPENYHVTFAEMTTKEKNRISHRSIAISKLIYKLKELQ